MGNLSNQYISQSFQSLLHLGSDTTASTTFAEIQDALGNGVGVFVNTTGNLRVTNAVSASAVSASTLYGLGNPLTYSASVSDQLKALENITSSLINKTGSYATTGSNSFVGNQSIGGDLVVSGQITANSIYTVFETSSVIFSSGSNILGDATNDTQTLIGLIRVSGSSQITGSVSMSADLSVKGIMSASRVQGIGNVTDFSSSVATQFYTINQTVNNYTSSINQLNDATSSLYSSVYNLNNFTTSINTYTAGINAFTSSQNTKDVTLASITASLIITSSNLATSQSIDNTKWNTLQTTTSSFSASVASLSALTGSYVTTGSNTFTGRQTMNLGLFVPRSASSSSISSVSSSLAVNPLDIVLTASTASLLPGVIQLQGGGISSNGANNGVRIIDSFNITKGGGLPQFSFIPVSASKSLQYLSIGTNDTSFIGGSTTNILIYSSSAALINMGVDNSISLNTNINVKPAAEKLLSITGSINVSDKLNLTAQTLTTGSAGDLAVSGSNLYFYSGSAWRKVTLG